MTTATDPPPTGASAPAPSRHWTALDARPGPTRRRFAVDTAVALLHLLLSGGLPDPHTLGAQPLDWVRPVLCAVVAAGIVLRWRWPAASFGAVLAAGLAATVAGWGQMPLAAAAWALYPLALTAERGPTRPRHGLYLLAGVLAIVAFGTNGAALDGVLRDLGVGSVLLGLSWLLGRSVRERSVQEARAVAAVAREARVRERLRVAREVHDVVSHTLGAVGMRAGVARYTGGDAEDLRAALADIEAASRQASDELRRVLVSLRGDHDAPLGPRPGPADLEALVATAESTGITCRLRTEGAGALPPAVADSVHRVVQEALTNAIRHAPGSACEVTVLGGAAAVEVEVIDTGPAPGRVPVPGSGTGLAGMAERVAAHGGTLSAGPLPGGGHRLRAHIPFGPGPG
ncbi:MULTISPECIES: sensor histidine kinase [Nocardiopsis]|uniref:histidine kinase n=1 Tax=Nocardiopsis dassonvillei (strain ATCC 23218 / DSM 43111 / CIP 107115 / JCM 7437 / KCTC 9190 / NBRC 14626 / NCTC 10488 / NRRL B-5397 / IMRU 509) TaxID=446468 RepID=D7AV97_NOCDD|nr:histidine kinase [Nocardiopsis dassonvillei]ADH65758.1 integral membrane sensor signal transduction histidine kinase [Nocardiopsis dassonvillei subsp. dassonvillei DSM 43111]APC34101.1 two-component sensor histidine kinase [Nocardiopsis dassonvillei]VEI91778.1 Sensor histidine kinase desK [Nocardiopsis dassonvillei]